MKSKTKTLPTDAVLRDMLKQAGLDSAGVQFRLLGDGMFNAVFAAVDGCSPRFWRRRQTRRW